MELFLKVIRNKKTVMFQGKTRNKKKNESKRKWIKERKKAEMRIEIKEY